jgi:hypothetical protein
MGMLLGCSCSLGLSKEVKLLTNAEYNIDIYMLGSPFHTCQRLNKWNFKINEITLLSRYQQEHRPSPCEKGIIPLITHKCQSSLGFGLCQAGGEM